MENLPRPILRVTYGENEGQYFEIINERFVIGRSRSCDWTIDSKKISRTHLEIYNKNGYWFAKDLDSKNYSYLNGSHEPLQKSIRLKYGDKIQLAKVLVFQFSDPNATSADSTHQVLSKGLVINKQKGIVYINGKKVSRIPSMEYELLLLLYERNGKLVRNEEIVQKLWGGDDYKASLADYRNLLYKLISRLSKRLSKYSLTHKYIGNVRGEGRRFVQRR